jgi:hypothetical protein
MRNLIAAALVALAGSAEAGARHTWFQLHYDTATCEASRVSPQEFQNDTGHANGLTAERIAPDDAVKYNDGTLEVTVRGTSNGKPVKWRFFSSKEMCNIWLVGIKPQRAPAADIN